MQTHEAYALCQTHMNKFVRIQMHDGAVYEGVIEKLDNEHVYIACPGRSGDGEEQARYFPYPGWGGPFGFGPRFRRFALPLFGLAALSLLPYWYI
ncbi:MAG: hypothetical protein K0R57_4439 [Paenibacillaceae bacterium]|jgi:hypothetical protein|nr:hypothetical protein [Paenibacillaceae bacterium]